MSTTADHRTRARSLARRVAWHPLLWAVACVAGALPLLGTAHDFWGFLLSLGAGWLVAFWIVGRVVGLRSRALSFGLHVGLAVLAGVMLAVCAQPVVPLAVLPPTGRAAVSFAMLTAAGWVWLTLIGRVSGAVGADSARRASRLVQPEWRDERGGWVLRTPVVVVRRAVFLGIAAAVTVLVVGLLGTFVIAFAGVAQRMSPMVLFLVFGWVLGVPGYLLLRTVARARTVIVDIRLDHGRFSVRRSSDQRAIIDVALDGIRVLRWMPRATPSRVVVRPVEGAGLVPLIGLARRSKNAAAVPDLPTSAVRAAHAAGLSETRARAGRDDGLTLERGAET